MRFSLLLALLCLVNAAHGQEAGSSYEEFEGELSWTEAGITVGDQPLDVLSELLPWLHPLHGTQVRVAGWVRGDSYFVDSLGNVLEPRYLAQSGLALVIDDGVAAVRVRAQSYAVVGPLAEAIPAARGRTFAISGWAWSPEGRAQPRLYLVRASARCDDEPGNLTVTPDQTLRWEPFGSSSTPPRDLDIRDVLLGNEAGEAVVTVRGELHHRFGRYRQALSVDSDRHYYLLSASREVGYELGRLLDVETCTLHVVGIEQDLSQDMLDRYGSLPPPFTHQLLVEQILEAPPAESPPESEPRESATTPESGR
jgi:hypothetical protein